MTRWESSILMFDGSPDQVRKGRLEGSGSRQKASVSAMAPVLDYFVLLS